MKFFNRQALKIGGFINKNFLAGGKEIAPPALKKTNRTTVELQKHRLNPGEVPARLLLDSTRT